MDSPEPLARLIAQQMPESFSPELQALRDQLLRLYGASVEAMIFYGSCLRSGDALDGLVDLYLVVKDYRGTYPGLLTALFNRLLPPNVYYLEVPFGKGLVRAKYAVISIDDLERGTSGKWFHSYLWGRFCQPCGLLFSRDPDSARRVHTSLSQAVTTFLNRVLPSLPQQLEEGDIWKLGLALSYRAELRTEKPERAVHLYEAWKDHYQAITARAMAQSGYSVEIEYRQDRARYLVRIPESTRSLNRMGWLLRSFQGKFLSLLRLIKSTFTFQGGMDYIAWKLERHTGVPVEVTPKMRSHPLIYSWGLVWRLYRRGLFR